MVFGRLLSPWMNLLAFLLIRSNLDTSNEASGEVIEKWHPLLPAEKKLIMYCLIIAAALLVILVWVSYTYFRIGTRS